jgi:MerR family transcriptional regulator, light-induced transcriptional regulator
MAFIRIKKIKGYDYYYLVRSQWDPVKKRSTQHIIKYLGNAENINIKDIPEEHRDNPKVLSLLVLFNDSEEKRSTND